MKKVSSALLTGLCSASIASIALCGVSLTATAATLPALKPAPSGPKDLGPATGLSEPAPDAVVFDLKYHPQTGGKDDIQYFSFWGFGSNEKEARADAFIKDVLKNRPNAEFYFASAPRFKGRPHAAVECANREAVALYFDLNADGKFSDNERIEPTSRRDAKSVQFITPDFANAQEDGRQVFTRVMLEARFYGTRPNFMWGPAAVLESESKLNGQNARLLLYSSAPGGLYDEFGSARYALLLGKDTKILPGGYIPRENLSSLVYADNTFYRLKIEGKRANGLPARVVLVKDTTPTGKLAPKLVGAREMSASLPNINFRGVSDKSVFFRVANVNKKEVTLPVGTYQLANGSITYGESKQDWEVSFSEATTCPIKAGELTTVTLGKPVLKVRAVEENERYNPSAVSSSTFKKNTKIYLEPRIVGADGEVFTRFAQMAANKARTDRPPKVTITNASGKQVLSKTMEYG